MKKKLNDNQINESLSNLSLSWKLDEIDHHPKWTNIYNTIEVELNTHDINGISILDFELSEFMNMAYSKIENN